MTKIRLEIRKSYETNDNEVRLFVDERDGLGDDYLGLDPPEFFAQFSNPASNQLFIGRCLCGVVGCNDYIVVVQKSENEIIWRGHENWYFSRKQYEEEIIRASNDHTWEDKFRRAERLANEVLRGCKTKGGLLFQWTSARIAPKAIKVSFGKDGEQEMFEFHWDEATDESVKRGAEYFKNLLVVT